MIEINQNNLDEWLFEYFEGNLDQEKAAQVLAFVKKDPTREEEFKYWKNAVISESLPVNFHLENNLLRKKSYINFWPGIALDFSITLFLVAGSYMSSIHQDPHDLVHNTKPTEKINNILTSIPKPQQNKEVPRKNIVENFKKENPVQSEILDSLPAKEISKEPEVATNINILNQVPDTLNHRLNLSAKRATESLLEENNDTKIISENSTHTLTKKELKKIEKVKEKARQKREEEEFMKGNVPYVVPTNPNF